MKKRIATASFLFLFVTLAVMPGFAYRAQSNTNKASAKGEMKSGGKEATEAGKSLGTNVKKGKVVQGGKEFGQHTSNSAKHVAKGTAKGTKAAAKGTAKGTKTVAKGAAKGTETAAKKTASGAKKTGGAVKKAVTP